MIEKDCDNSKRLWLKKIMKLKNACNKINLVLI